MIELKDQMGITQIRKICDQSPSRIFGFIMYTKKHSYIAKVLRDSDFWGELDEISGANWPIFSVRPLSEGVRVFPQSNGIFLEMMISVWREPNDNRLFLDVFSLDESRDLPCFVAFIWKDNDEIEQIVWRLSNENQDAAFNSIREVVQIISETEELILPEYKRTENVFRNVKINIEARIAKHSLIKRVKSVRTLIELFTSLSS
jgi:hypothetical protein